MTPTEERIARIYADYLGLDCVEVEDDPFGLGADSVEAVRMALQIERDFDIKLPADTLETAGSVREVAALIDSMKNT
jgi:acyl carrier protein